MRRTLPALLTLMCGCSAELSLPADVTIRCGDDAQCGEGVCVTSGWCGRADSGCVALEGGVYRPTGDGGACVLESGGAGVCAEGVCTRCGDGRRVAPEQCDDGNRDDGDACTSACVPARCGDGLVQSGVEACDDGNAVNTDACLVGCVVNTCGDGFVNGAAEACDDVNDNANDGCDACQLVAWQSQRVIGLGPDALSPRGAGFTFDDADVDAAGNVFLAARYAVWRYDVASGVLMPYAGSDNEEFSTSAVITPDLPARQVRFSEIRGLAVAPDGTLYVADRFRNVVYRVTERGTLEVVAGDGTVCGSGAGCGLGGFATQASFFPSIVAIDVDARGDLYVRDWLRVYRVDGRTRLISVVAGSASNCSAGNACGDGTSAVGAQLVNDGDIAVDDSGNLAIVEQRFNEVARVRWVDKASGDILALAGHVSELCSAGPCGDGGPPLDGRFHAISGVDVAADGTVYVSDATQARVRRIDAARTRIEAFAGSGACELDQGCGDGGPIAAAALRAPVSVAAASDGAIYVVDMAGQASRLRAFAGGTASTVVGSGLSTFYDREVHGQLGTSTQTRATSFAVRANGDIVFSNVARLLEWRRADGVVSIIAGNPRPCVSGACGDGGPARDARFRSISDLEVTSDGVIWLADGNRVRRIDPDGTVSAVAGSGSTCAAVGACDASSPLDAAFSFIGGIEVTDTAAGRFLYVLDAAFNVVRRVTLPDGPVELYAGTGDAEFNGDSGDAKTLNFACDIDMTADAAGDLYISDYANCRVLRVHEGAAELFGPSSLERCQVNLTLEEPCAEVTSGFQPAALTHTGAELLVTMSFGAQVGRLSSSALTPIPYDATFGFARGDGGPLAEAIVGPVSRLAPGPGGAIVLAGGARPRFTENTAQSVREVGADGVIRTLIGSVDGGTMGGFDIASLDQPSALVALDAQRVLVAEGVFGRLRLADLTAGRLATVAGYVDGFAITDTPASARYAARFTDAAGLAFDAARARVFVADAGAHRIYVVDVSAADPAAWTVARFAGDTRGHRDGAAAQARFDTPRGLAFDAGARTLWVADSGNHVLRAIAVDAPDATVESPIGSPQRPGFKGDGGAPSAVLLDTPAAVAVSEDRLCVADTFNDRVRCEAGGVFETYVGPAEGLVEPTAVAFDAYGNLLVTGRDTVVLLVGAAPGGELRPVLGGGDASFPASVMRCMSALLVRSAGDVLVGDACQGLVVQLGRVTSPR